MNHLLCMGSVIMSTLIVYTYCTSTKSIINKVRYSSIAATTFWTLSNIAWNINWHHDAFLCANYYNLTFSEDSVVSSQVFRYSRQIAFVTQAMGYFFFALSFLYRLIHSFKDSFFEISDCCKNSAIVNFEYNLVSPNPIGHNLANIFIHWYDYLYYCKYYRIARNDNKIIQIQTVYTRSEAAEKLYIIKPSRSSVIE